MLRMANPWQVGVEEKREGTLVHRKKSIPCESDGQAVNLLRREGEPPCQPYDITDRAEPRPPGAAKPKACAGWNNVYSYR